MNAFLSSSLSQEQASRFQFFRKLLTFSFHFLKIIKYRSFLFQKSNVIRFPSSSMHWTLDFINFSMTLVIRFYCRKIVERLSLNTTKTSSSIGSPAINFPYFCHAIRQKKFRHLPMISLELLPKRKPKRDVFGWLMAFSLAEFLGAKDAEPAEVKKIMNKAKKILEVIFQYNCVIFRVWISC